jgi:hypothetical protein
MNKSGTDVASWGGFDDLAFVPVIGSIIFSIKGFISVRELALEPKSLWSPEETDGSLRPVVFL